MLVISVVKVIVGKGAYGSIRSGFVCGKCGRVYRRRRSLQRHLRYECQKEPTFLCPYCPYKAKQKRKFACEKCGKAYKHKVSLQKHVKFECQKEPSFCCQMCPYKAKLKENLKAHYDRLDVRRVFERTGIKSRFESMSSIFLTEQYPCEKCDKVYLRKSSKMRHVKYECGKEKLFACPYCDKQVKQKYNLLLHVCRRHQDWLDEFKTSYYSTL
ncbi:Longitudinals lacking protein, isoforms N/O/W/X/Y-like Protein [Tribolium castaneum]|uniref:Longitudinals lacking protein, isoforms N/O/W/X/Y-like Protein n=1 Tax=Tribolium castaneum TaxID=7070 RepID=A0A139WLZ4_TRICA|nr:Longitudinals lacking protein, isoforms N/O/W/X/Y-like Protein [Tribolium castaneum]